VSLWGEARPYATVTLYAKVSGYISEIRVDKGDHVEADQVLAIVESPELNRQYDAAVADAKNKRSDAERNRPLLKSGAISPQNFDRIEATAEVAEQTAASLLAQKDYEKIRAPFAGTIAIRFVDPGALVQNATTAQTSALPVVTLSNTDRLRIYVYADQKTAGSIRVGDRVEVTDPTRRDVKVSATVTRTSGELDPKTRTLLVEIEVDNKDKNIIAGSFVQVNANIKMPPGVEVPTQALIIRENKKFVAVINNDNKVNLRPVQIDESDGKNIKLRSGVEEGERVALSVSNDVEEGAIVRPVAVNEKKRKA
jgi:membrane fusion protein, multidrug efflux system